MLAFKKHEYYSLLLFTFKWLLIASLVGLLAGSASAIFLILLHWATEWRESHLWIIALLPLGGFIIGASYYYLGKEVETGNNLLIDTIHQPGKIIPFKMAPLVLFGTIATHFFGGSAGREGTAVQMGGAISDQLTRWVKLSPGDRKLLIVSGISAGFASVFGTPLAGTIFGLEVFLLGRMRYDALFPAAIAAIVADYTTKDLWQVGHTHYSIDLVPEINFAYLGYTLLAGLCFGLAGRAFGKTTHFLSNYFKKRIPYPPLRPVAGGIILAAAFYAIYNFMDTTQYMGLGVPTIVEAFEHPLPCYDFAFKLLLTALTLGCGFKGGEVTPLFFIGAALGSTLSMVLPIPTALLAGMGFVAVFAGAANTPVACTLMAVELFGAPCGIYAGLACTTAYLFSGHTGIYASQVIGNSKHRSFENEEGLKLSEIEAKRKQEH